MADLTREIELTNEWQNISALLDNDDYSVDVIASYNVSVYQALTDNENAPSAAISGHPWIPVSSNRIADSRQITINASTNLWMRALNGSAILVVSPI